MHRIRIAFALAFALALGAAARGADAQELEPRAFTNTPVGLNFLIAGYAYAEGGVGTDPALPLQNANLRVHGPVLAYARSLDLGGRSGKLDVILPHSQLSGTADVAGLPVARNVSGLGDPRIRLSVNFLGAPALSLKEFGSYRPDVIAGASLQVTAPLGQYDADKLVNIGSNRWSFKSEVGFSKTWAPLTLELAAAATVYTDNTDFFGGKTRSQDAVYSLQSHLIYSFRSGVWVALNGTYYTGGRTAVDGVRGDDRLSSSRAGLTVTLPVDRRNSFKLFASTGVSTRTGSDFDGIGVAWQHRWGGGI